MDRKKTTGSDTRGHGTLALLNHSVYALALHLRAYSNVLKQCTARNAAR